MKKVIYSTVVILFLVINANAHTFIPADGQTITAVYKGISDDGQYTFKSKDGKSYLFDEISEGIEVDLSDEAMIGKTFEVSFSEETYEEFDDEGEPTGGTYTQKVITSLKSK